MHDPRTTQHEWLNFFHGPAPGGGGSFRDPLNAIRGILKSLDQPGSAVVFGTILDSIAPLYCYRVAVEGGRTILPCVDGTMAGQGPFSARQINSYGVNNAAIVWLHRDLDFGVILATFPDPATDPTRGLAGQIHRAGRNGVQIDQYVGYVPGNVREGITNWNANRPFDVTGGTCGFYTDTGMRLVVDPFMSMLALDEGTGLFVFYHDQMVRLAGPNLQELSLGHVRQIWGDEGEILSIDGSTPYPWEQLGVLEAGQDAFVDKSDKEVQIDPGHFASIEPKHEDQQPFHRVIEFGGYAAQGRMQIVQVPPESGSVYRYGEETAPRGLSRVHQNINGRLSFVSATGISFIKQAPIPAPKVVRLPEDPNGDNAENYRAAGQGENGDPHKTTSRVATNGENQPMQQAAGILDHHAHLTGWQSVHGLHYHEKDIHLPEEGDLGALGKVMTPPTFSELASKMFLDAPPPITVRVDHRSEAKVFPNRSYIDQLDDGGVLVGCGFGAEIRMTGGSVEISAPGDVTIRAGRSFNVLAGHDINARAKNSIDLNTTNGDIRGRAMRNMQLVSGVSGTGSLLLENQAATSYGYRDKAGEDVAAGGVHIKAPRGQVAVWANDLYLRSLSGDLVLDANKGQRQIVTHSQSFTRYIGSVAADYFGTDTPQTANIFGQNSAVLGSGLFVDGSMAVDGPIVNRGGMSTTEGQFGAEVEPGVGILKDKPLQQARDAISQIDQFSEVYVAEGVSSKQTTFESSLYAADQAGNDSTIEAATFSHRTVEQYRTTNFLMFEARWQQLARLSGQTARWEEKPVPSAPPLGRYPYPGTEHFEGRQTYFQQDPKLFDVSTGTTKARADMLQAYEQPEFNEAQARSLLSEYIAIV